MTAMQSASWLYEAPVFQSGVCPPHSKISHLVRVKGLEPPRLAAPEPKSGASTSSATPAFRIIYQSQLPNVRLLRRCALRPNRPVVSSAYGSQLRLARCGAGAGAETNQDSRDFPHYIHPLGRKLDASIPKSRVTEFSHRPVQIRFAEFRCQPNMIRDVTNEHF